MNFKAIVLFAFCTSLTANTRLERIQKYHIHDLEAALRTEIEHLLNQGSLEVKYLVESISSRVDTALYNIKSEQEHFSSRKFKSFQKRHNALETHLQTLRAHIKQIEFERSRIPPLEYFDKEFICSTYRDRISIIELPGEPNFRHIQIDVPKPEFLRQTGIFDSEYKPAEEAGAAVFTAGASAGCGAGAAIGVWFFGIGAFVGCAVGAGVGAGVGAAAGSATTAIMTSQNNIDEYNTYKDAYHREKTRQENEIRETENWLKQHPSDSSHLYQRAHNICLNRENWPSINLLKQSFVSLKEKLDVLLSTVLNQQLQDLELELKISSEEGQNQ